MKNIYVFDDIQIKYSPKLKASERIKLENPDVAVNIFRQLFADNMQLTEAVAVLLLSKANKLLGTKIISTGGIDSTVIDQRIIFQLALKTNATGIILGHNHPSGNINPSEQDKSITKKVKNGCDILGFNLIDHLIITDEDSFSFANEGLI